MKLFAIIFLLSITCLSQSDSTGKTLLYEEFSHDWYPDEPAQLIGGFDSVQARLIYPIEALDNNIEGTCYILINVDTLGIPSKPLLIKGIGYGCDKEAIRLVLSSKYLPAFKKEKVISSQMVVKVVFKLPKEE